MAAIAPSIATDSQIKFERMSGYTGVKITGVSLSEVSDAQMAEIQQLISHYCVAVFPGQSLSPPEHVALMARLGPITVTPGVDLHPDYDNVHVVNNRGNANQPVSGGFHTDTCFVTKPPSYTSLNAVQVPAYGGDTVFCNQYLAYDSLSDVMKGWLNGLRLKHVVSGTARPEAVPDPVWHPAVRTNPVTGRKALYVTYAARCVEAEGMSLAEGQNLIAFLYQHSLVAHAMYRHRWTKGDLVIWDNRCSLHAAVYDHGDQPRTLYRVMCEGEQPFED
ncbi:MAG: TauD/TfdA family dioxygenase [Gammaproteobacteria bacterium]|nr:TauD/TfdA family dioxygenase [Gammaproteobacteria bacterium]